MTRHLFAQISPFMPVTPSELRGELKIGAATLSSTTRGELDAEQMKFAQQWKAALPSLATNTAEPQPPQGDPLGLRFAPALTRPHLCQEESL
jgi:hypothetical protein